MFKTEWRENLQKCAHIMIFGAKQTAIDLYSQIRREDKDILYFIVSERRDNPYELLGKPVKVFDQIESELKEDGLVVISQRFKDNDNMKGILSEAGFRNVISSPLQSILTVENLRNENCDVLGEQRMSVREWSEKRAECVKPNIPVCIYAAISDRDQHVANRVYTSEYVKYIQAGAVLSQKRICDVADDIGDNISKWNPFFCELTAGYWIYKNDKENGYVGLFHYSRGLDIHDNQIGSIVEAGIDLVMPVPYLFRHEMAAVMDLREIEVIMGAIERVSPEYINSAKEYFLNKVFVAGNLIFAKKDIFSKYYRWLFRVLSECANIKQEKNIKIRERCFGYYGENLMNIFLIHNKTRYNTLYSEVEYMF